MYIRYKTLPKSILYQTICMSVLNPHYLSLVLWKILSRTKTILSYFPKIKSFIVSLEMCLLSNNILDYKVVSQGKTTIPNVDDGEELEMTDVSNN